MPYIVTGDPSTPERANYSEYNFDYDYPYGLDLKPDSEFHNKLRDKIWQRARESRNVISNRFPSWRAMDRTLTAYIPLKDKEKTIQEKDATKPVSVVFPYTYSVLESLLTYMVMAFFQDPMFQYEGVEDDDTIGAMLMELVIKIHCIKNKVPLAVHTILRDALSYGIGVGIPGWSTRYGKVPVKTSVVTESELGTNTENGVQFIDSLVFEGNDLDNIDPYMWLPDPSVSSDKIQKGEFNGWMDRDNYMNMLSAEAETDSGMFNVRYLKAKKGRKSVLAVDPSERETKSGGPTDTRRAMTDSTNPVDNIKMYINLVPKEWELGSGEYPEKWFFCLSADDVITECYKADHNHGLYPLAVASPDYDGYTSTPMGRLEILSGLQGIANFAFNSHVSAVRKNINNMLVVDPYLVNINDLRDSKEGGLIRLRRPAWGRGVDKVVQQLQVTDITRNNIGDVSYITQFMDRIAGADSSMSGTLRQGGPERLTRGEFQGTRGSAVSRLQRMAMLIGMQFMQDIGTMFAVHTQQNMTKETFVKITGRYEEQLKKQFGPDVQRARVSPLDLAVNTDLIVRDGSIPGGNFSEVWVEMFKIIGTSPELMQEFDTTRIFMYIAQQLGAKNVEDFKRNVDRVQPTVMPDDQVVAQVQAGNLVPVGA